ncbi:MAG: hypothetical protein GF384_09285 [Elusimicrobia bacterium]|nr:hypothetical protein [Elusimicrobiota bacterium]MBD3412775.1 hypothetical protein [Elusimicrobiota bacterium]
MKMTKSFSLFIAMVIALPVIALADPVPGSKAFNASVIPTGGIQEWFAEIKNIDNNQPAQDIQWSNVVAGSDTYKVADQYVEIAVNITNVIDWRMLIYTDNDEYTGNKEEGGFGLISNDNNRGLPLAWTVKESTTTVSTPVFDPNRQPTPGFTDFLWKFVVDQNQTGPNGWNPNNPYVRVWDNNGFYWHENPNEPGNPAQSVDDNVVVYFGAGFAQSLAEQYSTDSLTLDVLLVP